MHVLALLLVHIEVVAEVEERLDGLDCEVLDLGEDLISVKVSTRPTYRRSFWSSVQQHDHSLCAICVSV